MPHDAVEIVLKRTLAVVCLFSTWTWTLASCTPAELTGASPTVPPLATPTATRQPSAATIPFTTIAQGTPLGDHPTDPLYTVVVSPDKWNELRGRLPDQAVEAGIRASQSCDDPIIIAFAGVKESSGYSITVKRIVQESGQLVVVVSQGEPAPNDVVEPATTLPYHLVTLARKSLPPARLLTFTFRDAQGTILSQEDVPVP